VIVDPTIADAVLDRSCTQRTARLDGETLRNHQKNPPKRGKLDTDTPSEPLKPSMEPLSAISECCPRSTGILSRNQSEHLSQSPNPQNRHAAQISSRQVFRVFLIGEWSENSMHNAFEGVL